MAAPTTIQRFTLTERGLHWTHAISFLLLLLTGCFLYFPALSELAGNYHIAHLTILNTHVLLAAFYVGGPLLWWLLGDRRALRRDLHELDVWDDDDVSFLTSPLDVLSERPAPPQGRFNAGQKINTILLGASAIGFAVTGLLMWQASHVPAWASWAVQGSVNIHDILTLLTAALVAGHIYLAAVHPTTRPSLSGMFSGRVDRDWARHHHPKWVAGEESAAGAQQVSAIAGKLPVDN
jgi:formate dehydrogenase subunit gamma